MGTMRPARSSSLWLDKPDRPDHPPLEFDNQADVVVVGAGIVGLTTAAQLTRAGRRVIVLDRRDVGAVTTGNTTAKATVLHGLRYARIIGKHGVDVARAYAAANGAGLRWLMDEGRKADADVKTMPAYTYVTEPRMEQKIHDEVAAMGSAGVTAAFTAETGLPFAVIAAIRVDDQAQLDPIPHVDRLAREVIDAGGAVHGNTAVVSVRSGRPCRVTTSAGRTLRSDHVVLATGMPFTDRGLFFARLVPMRSYGVALPLDGPAPEGMYLSADQVTRSVRTAAGPGDRRYLVVGGEGHKVGQGSPTLPRFEALASWAQEHFSVREATHRWSAQDYRPADLLPYIGPAWPGTDRVLTATGFDKWGMTNGTAAGLALADAITNIQPPWLSTFSSNRLDLLASAGSIASANVDVAVHLAAGWLRPDVAARTPKEGEGLIDRRGLTKVARSCVDGTTHTVSARCTHLGGIVGWNDAEQSWDCPLHGSRFAPDGSVLEGPATRPLPTSEDGGLSD
jgi:glycine/D-amino acid oxidase-like deaminating enzyme/nitrite reductase/ring-hydroxylating ferredoxin subunit